DRRPDRYSRAGHDEVWNAKSRLVVRGRFTHRNRVPNVSWVDRAARGFERRRKRFERLGSSGEQSQRVTAIGVKARERGADAGRVVDLDHLFAVESLARGPVEKDLVLIQRHAGAVQRLEQSG